MKNSSTAIYFETVFQVLKFEQHYNFKMKKASEVYSISIKIH